MIDQKQAIVDQPGIGGLRLAVGLVQGLACYGLTEAAQNKVWPATDHWLFAVLVIVSAYVPLVILAGMGAMRRLTLLTWVALTTVILAGLALHEATRAATPSSVGDLASLPDRLFWPSFQLLGFGAVLVFVAHHLVAGSDQARRIVAPYPLYFDLAWKHGVQLALAFAFLGAFWIVLFLGAALFNLIGLKFVVEAITKPWFIGPASGVMFAAAVHLTDVRAALTRGARTLALTLLAWLTPVMGLLTLAFLVALPFTGLKPLWATNAATSVLLAAMAALIIFLNAAYQDGETDQGLVLRWSGRGVALILLPLCLIAAYGLGLRISQYGLSPARVIAVACVSVAALYALAYAAAAVRKGPWLKGVERANIFNAVVILAVLTAMFTPLADPARLAVDDQVGRLKSGRISPAKFDFAFLRFSSARYGTTALQGLARDPDPKIASPARAMLQRTAQFGPEQPSAAERTKAITVYPAGGRLPPDLFAKDWRRDANGYAPCLSAPGRCDAFLVDLTGDGAPEVLISPVGDSTLTVLQKGDTAWTRVGTMTLACDKLKDALRAGRVGATPSVWRDLEIGGQGVRLNLEGPPQAPVDACK